MLLASSSSRAHYNSLRRNTGEFQDHKHWFAAVAGDAFDPRLTTSESFHWWQLVMQRKPQSSGLYTWKHLNNGDERYGDLNYLFHDEAWKKLKNMAEKGYLQAYNVDLLDTEKTKQLAAGLAKQIGTYQTQDFVPKIGVFDIDNLFAYLAPGREERNLLTTLQNFSHFYDKNSVLMIALPRNGDFYYYGLSLASLFSFSSTEASFTCFHAFMTYANESATELSSSANAAHAFDPVTCHDKAIMQFAFYF